MNPSGGEPEPDAGDPQRSDGRAGSPSVGRRGWALTAVLTFAVLLGLAIYSDAGALAEALGSFEIAYAIPVVGLTLVAYGLRFAKWDLFLRILDVDLSITQSARVFFSGLMMAITPGKVGEVWKAWLTERSGGPPVAHTLPAVAAERVTDLVALTGLALLGVGAYQAPPWVLVTVFTVFGAGVLLIRSRSLCLGLLRRVDDWPIVGGFATEIETIYEGSFDLFAPGPLAASLALSLLAWGLEGVALWAALAGLGVDVGWLLPVFAFGLGSVLGAVSMLPGGLGAAETSMVGALVAAGVARPAAAGATLIVRAGTLWFGAVLGAIVFFASRETFRRGRPSHG